MMTFASGKDAAHERGVVLQALLGKGKIQNTLEDGMSSINDLLVACYFLGIDPLPILRATFKEYKWNYRQSTVKILRSTVTHCAHFVWRWGMNDDEDLAVITAWRVGWKKGGKPRFWVGAEAGAADRGTPIKLAEDLGAIPVVD